VSAIALPATLGRVTLRATAEGDLPFVRATETSTPFVRHWTDEEHRTLLRDPDCAHWTIETRDGRAGYLILRGLLSPDRSLELKRLNVAERGRGLGRDTLRLVKRIAFEELRAHRLWLDVMAHNAAARHLYSSEGFVPEGTLREALRLDGRYVDLVLMSVLEDEYRSLSIAR